MSNTTYITHNLGPTGGQTPVSHESVTFSAAHSGPVAVTATLTGDSEGSPQLLVLTGGRAVAEGRGFDTPVTANLPAGGPITFAVTRWGRSAETELHVALTQNDRNSNAPTPLAEGQSMTLPAPPAGQMHEITVTAEATA